MRAVFAVFGGAPVRIKAQGAQARPWKVRKLSAREIAAQAKLFKTIRNVIGALDPAIDWSPEAVSARESEDLFPSYSCAKRSHATMHIRSPNSPTELSERCSQPRHYIRPTTPRGAPHGIGRV